MKELDLFFRIFEKAVSLWIISIAQVVMHLCKILIVGLQYIFNFWEIFWSELFHPTDSPERLKPAVYLLVGTFVGASIATALLNLPTSQGAYLFGTYAVLHFTLEPWVQYEASRRNPHNMHNRQQK